MWERKQVFGAVSIQNNKALFYSVQEEDLMFIQTKVEPLVERN